MLTGDNSTGAATSPRANRIPPVRRRPMATVLALLAGRYPDDLHQLSAFGTTPRESARHRLVGVPGEWWRLSQKTGLGAQRLDAGRAPCRGWTRISADFDPSVGHGGRCGRGLCAAVAPSDALQQLGEVNSGAGTEQFNALGHIVGDGP